MWKRANGKKIVEIDFVFLLNSIHLMKIFIKIIANSLPSNLSTLFLAFALKFTFRWFVELLTVLGIFNDWTKYWTVLTLLCFWFVCFVLFRFVYYFFFLRRRHQTFITRQIAIAHLLSNCHCCWCCSCRRIVAFCSRMRKLWYF